MRTATTRRRSLIFVALTFFICPVLSNLATADDVFTSFEFNAIAPFTIGTSPLSAEFTAGAAETRGDPALYVSGLFAWHIGAGITADVDFETPASAVDFWARTDIAGVTSEVRIFDENNVEILSQTPTDSYVSVSAVRAMGETLIGRVEIANTGGGEVVVDDFAYTADAVAPPGFDPDNPIPQAVAAGSVEIELTLITDSLTAPNFGTWAPGDDPVRLFIVDQPGRIIAVTINDGSQSVFLDVSALLVPLGAFGPDTFDERGLLGLAFHPDYATNGLLYTYTSESVGGPADFSTIPMGGLPNHQSVVREFRTPDPANSSSTPDAGASRVLLRLDEPQFNHNAGALAFDSSGYLLIAVGDGGNSNDTGFGHGTGNAQDVSNPFGDVLRINPLGNNSANGQYDIPAANPLVGQPGAVDEIFAFGFRNPFRLSLDLADGTIYVADVGQGQIEEVDVVTAGGNYGWNLKEGSFFFDPGTGAVSNVDPGAPAGLIDPIAEYDHDEGIAIIGGFIYRGNNIPALAGKYIFGDFGSFNSDAGRIFYLDDANRVQAFDVGTDTRLALAVLGFAQDANGEIYLLANTTGTPFGDTGAVMRLDAVEDPDPPPSSGGGGGGSSGIGPLLLLVLGLLVRMRTRIRPIS
jgi:MYXO-CTERM domain-containing protein